MSIFDSDVFQSRHIGPDAAEAAEMVAAFQGLGVEKGGGQVRHGEKQSAPA